MPVSAKLAGYLKIIPVLLVWPAQVLLAQTHMELTPSLSIQGQYDDNIYLDPSNEQSDYLAMVRPGWTFSLVSRHTHLDLAYSPTFVRYNKEKNNNTTRHSGTLTFGQDISRHFHLDLSDTYTKSEEPLEETEGIEGARNTRNSYQRNYGNASLQLLFGPENTLTAGYRHEYLENKDDTVDDGNTQTPFADLMVHLNEKNAVALNYEYTKANFSRETGVAEDDYVGHAIGCTYIYNFTRHASGNAGYVLTTREFDGSSEDYRVHHGSIGFEEMFSPTLSASMSVGYFVVDNEESGNDDGYSYDALISKQFAHGHIDIGGEGGWDESYLEAESRGFSKYWSVNTAIEYRFLEPLTGYASGSYRHDKDESDQKWETMRARCGLRWDFLQWYALSVEYTYAERDDDVDTEDYRDNSVSLFFTAARLFRW